MLALYPEEQEKLFEHIKSVIPDGQKPVRTNPPILQEACNADTNTDIRTDALVDIFFGRLLRNPPTVPAGQYISYSRACCICVTCRQVTAVPKTPTEDTSLVTSNIRGEKRTIPIPKDVDIVISIPGLHYNRKVAYLPFYVIIPYAEP
jgi:hypothetical protein